jgi:hypothetical protein
MTNQDGFVQTHQRIVISPILGRGERVLHLQFRYKEDRYRNSDMDLDSVQVS